MTIHAVYENGVFKPLERVDLPEHTPVTVFADGPRSQLPEVSDQGMDRIYEILGMRFDDPNSPGNLAERHNEHQP